MGNNQERTCQKLTASVFSEMNSKKLNICVLLSEPFDPDMPARPAITEIYGEYMPRFGHKVTWITPSREREGVQEKFFKGVKIYTIPRPLPSLLPLEIFNLTLYLIKEYRLLTAILKKEKYDIIQVRNDIFGALLALRIRKKYNIPFVFQYSFLKGTYKVQKPKERYLRYFGKFEECITRYILRKADLIFPISKWMETELFKEGMPQSKLMPLPMGINPELFSLEKDRAEIRKKYNLNNQVIVYVGTMGKLRALDIIIYAFSKVKEHRDEVKLLLLGHGNGRPDLEELALTLGIQSSVIFTGLVPYFDVPDYIAVSDVCLSPVPPLPIYKVSSPAKLFEYMAMARPVVANEEIPEHKEVIENSGGGILVPFTSEAFARAIIEVLDNPEKAAEMGRRGREWVVKNRSYEILARQVEERYYQLLRK